MHVWNVNFDGSLFNKQCVIKIIHSLHVCLYAQACMYVCMYVCMVYAIAQLGHTWSVRQGGITPASSLWHSYIHTYILMYRCPACGPRWHTPASSHWHTHIHTYIYIHTYSCTGAQPVDQGGIPLPQAIDTHIYIHTYTYIHTHVQVPSLWTKVAYPCLKPLASWILDFHKRITFFNSWCTQGDAHVLWYACMYTESWYAVCICMCIYIYIYGFSTSTNVSPCSTAGAHKVIDAHVQYACMYTESWYAVYAHVYANVCVCVCVYIYIYIYLS